MDFKTIFCDACFCFAGIVIGVSLTLTWVSKELLFDPDYLRLQITRAEPADRDRLALIACEYSFIKKCQEKDDG